MTQPDPTFALSEADSKPKPRKRKPEDLDLSHVLDSPEGMRFIRRLLDRAGLFHTTFDPDPQVMAFREGGRNLGLAIVAMISQAKPDALADILTTPTP